MRKWILLLALALLLNVVQARAEAVYYTNNSDRYYHLDADCDRPEEPFFNGLPVYDRAIYQKYVISEIAAVEFQKKPCPVCVKQFAPVYLGEHMTEWNFDAAQPWEFVSGDFMQFRIEDEAFKAEVAATKAAFQEYYAEYAEYGTGIVRRKHEYPACFAGNYKNIQGSYSYLIVDPTEEIIAAFEKMFGGGAWFVPAKYGYDEMDDRVVELMISVQGWCTRHPEVNAGVSTGGVDEVNNCIEIGIWGEDWQLAAAAMEEIAPIYVHFMYQDSPVLLDAELQKNSP